MILTAVHAWDDELQSRFKTILRDDLYEQKKDRLMKDSLIH